MPIVNIVRDKYQNEYDLNERDIKNNIRDYENDYEKIMRIYSIKLLKSILTA